MTFTPEARPAPPTTSGTRQRAADFTGALAGLSATVRPDALVLDPLVAYALGPVAIGDGSQGPTAWAWRVRATATQVLLARETVTRDGWEPETVLFTYAGAPILEVDVAFEQQGNVVVVAQRNTGAGGSPAVWLYFLDATVPGFVFTPIAEGRTPRCVLDNPQNPADSDVLVAYLDSPADMLRLRQQRDRYLVAYDTPLTGIADFFLEELVMSADNRLRGVLSRRDPASGTYSLRFLDSVLYPFVLAAEDAIGVLPPVLLATSTLEQLFFDIEIGPETSPVRLPVEDALAAAAPLIDPTSTLGEPVLIITPESSPLRLPAEDAVRTEWPVVLATSTLVLPIIAIDQTSTPARLPAEDALRPAPPTVLATSLLLQVVILVQAATNPRLVPEDAVRPAHPTILATSTLL